jgi:hypothetical protein
LVAPPAILAAGTPLVDASTYLAAVAVLWAIERRSTACLVTTLVIGVFAREPTVLLAIPAALSRRFRWYVPLGTAAIAFGTWLVFKMEYDHIHPYASSESTFSVQAHAHVAGLLRSTVASLPLILRSALQTYLGIGALALYGWPLRNQLPGYIRALGPWLGICGLAGLVLGNFDRISFMGAPALLPYSLLGLQRMTVRERMA